jgi:hypothetical protein
MREPRIKVAPATGEATYHCLNHVVDRDLRFDDRAKETFRKLLWRVADYCGVEVLTYTILDNHFHVTLRVPQTAPVAAYIDLNAVRAGLVQDPKDYRFCGYAEAVAGGERARRGLMAVLGLTRWEETQDAYRQMLFGTGAEPREHAAVITAETLARVVAEGGRLPLATVLRCRLRCFSAGAVLGGRTFVEDQAAAIQARTGRRRRNSPLSVPGFADWGELVTLRGLRGNAVG